MSIARFRKLAHPLLWVLVAFALIVLSQPDALADLYTAWQSEEYSHGLLIPFIALFLAWHRLAEAKPTPRPAWLGIGVLALAGAMMVVARLSAFNMAAEYGFIVALAGLSLAYLGRKATWAVAPALFYLIFAVPLPHLVQANLSQQLQLWSSTLGVWMLELTGVSVFQQGNVIDLGTIRLQVVEACSGLRYLFPLMSFGYLVALLLKDRMWKRIVIFLSTIPLTIGLNSLRIAFIGYTADIWGSQATEGFIHGFEGWSIFLISVAILMVETFLLLCIGKKGRFRYEYLGRARGQLFSARAEVKKPGIAAMILAAVFAIVFGTNLVGGHAEIIPPHQALASFPVALGDWRGQQNSLSPDVLKALQLSDYWIADYRRKGDRPSVNLYISYYASQRTGAMAHSPSNCIPGGGWQIENSRIEKLQLPGGASLNVTRLLIRRGENAQLVYYWFDERGRNLTETYSAKWYLLLNSILMHRTDGALIRLITPFNQSEDEKSAEARLNDFLAIIYPQIALFIPGSTAINPVAAP